MHKKTIVILVLIFSIFFVSFFFAKGNKEIPLEDFFRNPQKIDVKLSPNGKYLSYMASWKNRLNIFVKNLKTAESKQITYIEDRNIKRYFWVNNNKIIYIKDHNGDENDHLYAITPNGKEFLDLTPFDGVKCSVLDELDNIDNEILFLMNKRDKKVFDVYRLDVDSGNIELVSKNPGNVVDWKVDNNGKLKLAIAITDGVNTTIKYRATEKDDWNILATCSFKEKFIPLFFTFDNKQVYVLSNVGRDKIAIFKYDLKTKKEIECIFQHSEVDAKALLRSKKRKKIIGATYVTDKIGYRFFDENFKKIQEFINNKLPNYENYVVSNDKEEKKYIIHSLNDRTMGSYYLFDLENWKLIKLFDVAPWLEESKLSYMKPISYKSRDGLTIHGYLTLPIGKKPKNLPLVVNPHGGPWARDFWRFNSEVQFLANRGFAVLQMNFRGSTGYGKKFWESSFKQWGLKMQDDITDGVYWAINKGIADPKRIAIYGGSYGGYAALSGIIRTPDLYAAAIDYVGVTNLFTILNTIPPYWEPIKKMMFEKMGDPEKDKEQFIATSPSLNAHKIKTPLFIAQGANDPRVKKTESDQMVEALKKNGIEVEYMVKDDEGHGFRNEENKFDFYRAMEKFLKKHIGKK